MNTESLEKLRNSLPRNYKAMISKITGFSEVYVWQVINGERLNVEIIDAAIEVAKETIQKEKARVKAIENL